MQINATISCHLIPTKTAIIKKISIFQDMETSEISHTVDWNFQKRLNIELPYSLAIPLLGIYTRKIKQLYWNYPVFPLVSALLLLRRLYFCHFWSANVAIPSNSP